MKIDAKITFSKEVAEKLDRDYVRVPVDMDYVEDSTNSVYTWVVNELEEMFGRPFMNDDFEITNMHELIEELKFNEFENKTN